MFTEKGHVLSEYRQDQENKSSECLKSDFSEFKFDDGLNAANFPTNCALAVINADLPLNL